MDGDGDEGAAVYTLREAKAKLSQLLDDVAAGHDVMIRRGGAKNDAFLVVPRPVASGYGSLRREPPAPPFDPVAADRALAALWDAYREGVDAAGRG